MLSPSDFNNAVPQFTNGDYASNPINPQYIAEPDAVDYNKGAEPLQTLPAQWWNWFLNRFTNRFNKVNIYVKNIFNELTQLLSLVSETPSGTESTPTVGQMKDMFETKYPDFLKTTPALSNTYVPQTTRVNGHELCENITITCVACASCNGSGTAFGTASTLNTGTAAGCIPIVGTALGTTNGQFIATDASGCLKPSGYTSSCFRASTWTPSCVSCAGAVLTCGFTQAYLFDVKLTNGITTQYQFDWVSATCRLQFCSTTGILYAKCFCGIASNAAALSGYGVSADAIANSVGLRTSQGFFNATIFRDEWEAEDIRNYSSPKLVFKGNGDGYLRNTDPAYVTVGCATRAGIANARYCGNVVCVYLRCTGSSFGNCYYDVCVCSTNGLNALVAPVAGQTYGCCSGLLGGCVVYHNRWICVGCVTGQGLSSYTMPGINIV